MATKNNQMQFTWNGDKNRPFQLCRPCPCGCDFRDGKKGVGYLTGSNSKGDGFTLWIEDEKVYNRIEELLKK